MCMEYFLAYLLDDLAQAVPCKRKRVSKENRDDLKVDKERNLGKEKPSSLWHSHTHPASIRSLGSCSR
ncbi:hypothetical protein D6C76_09086 [Aureobasidium pullulans]|nr:hypothetical protein D6C76_09086 [Aureobasidium pullulans]